MLAIDWSYFTLGLLEGYLYEGEVSKMPVSLVFFLSTEVLLDALALFLLKLL